jgi:hypothetical protein
VRRGVDPFKELCKVLAACFRVSTLTARSSRVESTIRRVYSNPKVFIVDSSLPGRRAIAARIFFFGSVT